MGSDAPASSKSEGRFPVTRWTLIGRIQGNDVKEASAALEEVFKIYRYPLYSYLRSTGLRHEDAEDVLQGFFAKMIRLDGFQRPDQERGKLRTFLLSALSRFRLNWIRDEQRHHGRETTESRFQDEYEARFSLEQHATEETPELFFERRWAAELIRHSLNALEKKYQNGGKMELFRVLAPGLWSESSDEFNVSAAATQLRMTDNALRVALHRTRQDFRKCLLDEVGKTVTAEDDVKEEIGHMLSLFSA